MASDREITLGDVWAALWRGKWIIIVTTLVAAVVALALTFAEDTSYTATAKVYLGQATTMTGSIASTPGTNPLTAATILQGDSVVEAVASKTGLPRSVVRSRVDIAVPRAPGTTSTNQPAVATITASGPDHDDAVRLANAYAEVALTDASTGYVKVRETLEAQVARMRAEVNRLQVQLQRLTAEGAPGAAVAIAAESQLSDLRESLTFSELQLARGQQIEAPAIITVARGAASSGSATNRVRTAIVGAVIGLLVGIVIALATSGGLRRGARSTG